VTMATLPMSSLVVMPVPQLVIVRESGRSSKHRRPWLYSIELRLPDAPHSRGKTALVRRSLCAERREIDLTLIQPRHQPQGSIALRLWPAATRRVEREFVDHVLPGQGLLRTTTQVGLALLDHSAVLHRGPDMAS